MIRAEVQTARLLLRPVQPGDQAAVVEGLNDLAVSGWLSVVPFPYQPEDFQMFLAVLARPGASFALQDDEGFAGIMALDKAKLGYWLAPRAQGRGYATEAARGLLGWHFALGGGPVSSGHFAGNHRSASVLRKLGFVETGRGDLPCRARGEVLPHVDLGLCEADYRRALPWQAASARLTYRPLQATDGADLHQIVRHHAVTRQLGPRWPWPADPEFSRDRAQPFHGPGFIWGIFRQGGLIGTVGVAAGELGYLLAPGAWGQGYASEACRLALAQAFADGALRVEAGVWADNLASQHVLAKLGFRQTGADTAHSAARGGPSPGLRLELSRADWPGL